MWQTCWTGIAQSKMARLPEYGNAAYLRNGLYAFRGPNQQTITTRTCRRYETKESHTGRLKKEPFGPYKEIPEAVHRRALTNAFADDRNY